MLNPLIMTPEELTRWFVPKTEREAVLINALKAGFTMYEAEVEREKDNLSIKANKLEDMQDEIKTAIHRVGMKMSDAAKTESASYETILAWFVSEIEDICNDY